MRGDTGEPLAVIDGQALTLWRTAAASALAASYLAREDAGRLRDGRRRGARALPHRGACERSPDRRRRGVEPQCRARRVAGRRLTLYERQGTTRSRDNRDLEAAVRRRRHRLLRHAFTRSAGEGGLVEARRASRSRRRLHAADARERRRGGEACDDLRRHARRRAERGGRHRPAARAPGQISPSAIAGDLFDLCRRQRVRANVADEITLFKSVGTALEDLAAAAARLRRRVGSSLNPPSRSPRRTWRSSAAIWRDSRRPPGRRRAPASSRSPASTIFRFIPSGSALSVSITQSVILARLIRLHLGQRPVRLVVENGADHGREVRTLCRDSREAECGSDAQQGDPVGYDVGHDVSLIWTSLACRNRSLRPVDRGDLQAAIRLTSGAARKFIAGPPCVARAPGLYHRATHLESQIEGGSRGARLFCCPTTGRGVEWTNAD